MKNNFDKAKKIIFRPNEQGVYTQVTGDSGTLADYLLAHGIENIPEGTKFMRIDNIYFDAWIYISAYMVKFKIFCEYDTTNS